MSEPIIFMVTVDGYRGRVVLNPAAVEAEKQLVVEVHSFDAAGGDKWDAIQYRDSKRFVAAALLYAAVFGAQPGKPVEVGNVERSRLTIAPPPAYAALLGVGVVDPTRQLKGGEE